MRGNDVDLLPQAQCPHPGLCLCNREMTPYPHFAVRKMKLREAEQFAFFRSQSQAQPGLQRRVPDLFLWSILAVLTFIFLPPIIPCLHHVSLSLALG